MQSKNIFFFLLLATSACQKENPEAITIPEGFESLPASRPLLPGNLDEASGILDSKKNPGYLWVQQDSGNPNDIALLSHDGNFLTNVNIKTSINRDWEDMVLAAGPAAGIDYIYLADIGDNNLVSTEYHIYRFAEPSISADTVFSCDKISFQYPDGAHDAEAIFVDSHTKDIFIITKQDTPSKVYKLSYPQSTGSVNTAVLTATLSFSGVTAAALSPGGKELIIKTYTELNYWKIKNGQTVVGALNETPVKLSYQFEPQGEAICFKNDDSGFFTLSERPSVIAAVNLNFYKREH